MKMVIQRRKLGFKLGIMEIEVGQGLGLIVVDR